MNEKCPHCHSEKVMLAGYYGFCRNCGKEWKLDE